MPLNPPPGFLEDPAWADPILRSAYVDLQLRAFPGGEVLDFSLRSAGRWWGCSYRQARKIVDRLESAGHIRFPSGEGLNEPYLLLLADAWTVSPEEDISGSAPKPSPRKGLRDRKRGERISADQQKRITENPSPPDEEEEKKRATVHRLMGLLVELGFRGQQVTGALYGKQARVLKRLAEEVGPDMVERALRGMAQLFPHDQGAPFDAFRLERRLAEAIAAAPKYTPAEAEEERARAERERERAATLERARLEVAQRQWRARVEPLVGALPRAEKEKLWARAQEAMQKMPTRLVPQDPEKRKGMAVELALTLWGRENGHPPPR